MLRSIRPYPRAFPRLKERLTQHASDPTGGIGLTPWRVILALVLTPLLPAFYAAILFASPWNLPIGLAVGYPSELLFGLPLFLLCRSRGWLAWHHFAAIGAVTAVPAIVVHWWLQTPPHVEPFGVESALGTLAFGTLSGF